MAMGGPKARLVQRQTARRFAPMVCHIFLARQAGRAEMSIEDQQRARLGRVRTLASGLLAALDRPEDYYMQRQLFPDTERVAGDADSGEKTEQLAARGQDGWGTGPHGQCGLL